MSRVIAIVGRPNVGKSRLFNRLIRKGDEAIVHGEPGVTRDRQYGQGTHEDEEYTVVDTGGMVEQAEDDLMERMRRQAEIAIREADAIVFVMDGRAGLRPGDQAIAEMLRESDEPVVFAVNKVDPGVDPYELLSEFYQLGVDLQPISAEHNRGIDALLDQLMAVPAGGRHVEVSGPHETRCAIVGKPNVGKSTLLNAILGEERVLTSEEPGTTRDSIDTRLRRDDREYLLIDTAGMRKKSNVDEGLEQLSVVQSIRSIDRADVALMMIEGPEGVTNQDKKIAGVVERRGCACVLLVNKWDLVERYPETGDLYRDYLREELNFLDWAPIIFTSAVTGRKIGTILDTVDTVHESYQRRIETSPLNDFLQEAKARHSPPMDGDRRVKLYYGTQVATEPPTFVFFANYPDAVRDSYKRYLENRLREAFDFDGTPIRIYIKSRD